MADLITFNRDSDNLAKPTRLNLINKNLLIKTGQMSERSIALSRNEDSRSRVDDTDNEVDGESTPISKTSISKSKQKKVISVASISRLSTPRRSYKFNEPSDLTKVKMSALLYEITERTNQLAQPRSRVREAEVSQKTLNSKALKSMSRIIELACPRVIPDSALKPTSFVSPSALKAIATQRVIELSQPRKNRHYKLSECKTQTHRSCNLRIRGLFKSKQMDRSRVKAQLLDSLEEDKLDAKLFQRSLRLTSDVICDARSKRRYKRKYKSRLLKEKRQLSPRRLGTNSERSVVIIGTD